jgi:hypothetical protein
MCRKVLSKCHFTILCFVCAVSVFAQTSSTLPEIAHIGAVDADSSLQCIYAVTGKHALLQSAVDLKLRIEPCPQSRSVLEDFLKGHGLRMLDAGEFLYVIPSDFFPHFPRIGMPTGLK